MEHTEEDRLYQDAIFVLIMFVKLVVMEPTHPFYKSQNLVPKRVIAKYLHVLMVVAFASKDNALSIKISNNAGIILIPILVKK